VSLQVEGLRRFVGTPPERERTFTNVVVTAGGKGGVGTSTVTALMGLGLARAGRRVLVVDGSDGSLHLLLGLDAGAGLLDWGRGSPATHALEWVDSGLAVLASGPDVSSSLSTPGPIERRSALARVASVHTTFDLVLIDGGSNVDSVVQACSMGVDRLLTVTNAGRLSMAGTFGLLRAVSARFPNLPLQLVVNREPSQSLSLVNGRLRDALQHFHRGPVATAGLIPFDPDLEEATRRDGLLQDLSPSSLATRAALRLGLTMTLGLNLSEGSISETREPVTRELKPTGT